jgi:hypothetical protein
MNTGIEIVHFTCVGRHEVMPRHWVVELVHLNDRGWRWRRCERQRAGDNTSAKTPSGAGAFEAVVVSALYNDRYSGIAAVERYERLNK